MRKLITFSLFIFTFSFVAHAAPSWAALNTAAYEDKDTSPSTANAANYSAYFCTAAQAESLFGGTSVSAVETYLATHLADGKSALSTTGVDMNQSGTYGLDQYTFVSYYASAIAEGSYLAVAFYGDEAFRVFGTASAEYVNGSLAFDDQSSSGTVGDWKTATSVPEPTSGLLLLVGGALLALRRRRA